MNKEELLKKITERKEYSQLPSKDVEMAFSKFDKLQYSDEEKIKLTRELLRKVFVGFTSKKILKIKDKNEEWILNKHKSTKERLPHYKEVYSRIFESLLKLKKDKEKKIMIFDLGAGINGLSYKFFPKGTNYIGIEAVGQLVEISNYYFSKNKIENAGMIHMSLFEKDKLKEIISSTKNFKGVFMLKVLDSLEMIERNYSKKIIREILPISDIIVISFATRSIGSREKFKIKRYWFENFLKDEKIKILDDFEIGGERYILIKK